MIFSLVFAKLSRRATLTHHKKCRLKCKTLLVCLRLAKALQYQSKTIAMHRNGGGNKLIAILHPVDIRTSPWYCPVEKLTATQQHTSCPKHLSSSYPERPGRTRDPCPQRRRPACISASRPPTRTEPSPTRLLDRPRYYREPDPKLRSDISLHFGK